jgi:hypothetical protein
VVTARERANLEARFRKDMLRLRDALHRGSAPAETEKQFAERLITALEVVLKAAHKRSLLTALGQPLAGRGRPAAFIPPPSSRRPGAPTKFTSDVEASFVADIDRRKAKLAAEGRRATDRAALQWAILSFYMKRFRKAGLSKAEATLLAQAASIGPLLKTRQAQLARLRSRLRKRRD